MDPGGNSSHHLAGAKPTLVKLFAKESAVRFDSVALPIKIRFFDIRRNFWFFGILNLDVPENCGIL